jgi:dihydrofolate reductase
MLLSIISAMDLQRVIGLNNKLPWHLPADLLFFKNKTWGKSIIMGRHTFESIGKPLPGRKNIIVSTKVTNVSGCKVVPGFSKALQYTADEDEVFVIGGASLYRQALTCAQRMYLTLIHAHFAGDTYFPKWDPKEWQEISRQVFEPDAKNPYHYSFLTFERKQGNAKN